MNITEKIKKKLYSFTNEAKKIRRPSYSELIKYSKFKKTKNNIFAISFGAGRSGQNWFTKIFNSHPNWIGTCERFPDYEAFYRYVTFYNLPINKSGFYKLIELASKRDMSQFKNSLISSPYMSFGVRDVYKVLDIDYIFFIIRDPINAVESFYNKGWYVNEFNFKIKSPLIDISTNQYRSFSRIIPMEPYLQKWIKLTRIGKITWFWSIINKAIYDDFSKIQNDKKIFIKLEEVNQNYEFYEKLSNRFNFEKKMNIKNFYSLINKVDNKGKNFNYRYPKWSKLEKKEFEEILESFFPYYDKIKTNI